MMLSVKQQEMLQTLADPLRSTAIDISSEGSVEYAFPAARARDIFDELERAGVRVLGGDLWIESGGGYVSAHDSWYASSGSTPSGRRREWEGFVSRLSEGGDHYVTFVV